MSVDDALKAAHELLRKAVPGKRKLVKSESVLAQTYVAAMQHWDRQKADGVPVAERLVGLEKTIRAAWPFTREWKELCHNCADTGLVMAVCRKGARCDGISTRTDGPRERPGKYQRLCAKHPDSDYEHDYGTACWCSLGARFRDKGTPGAEEFSQAGKSKPMTRLGR